MRGPPNGDESCLCGWCCVFGSPCTSLGLEFSHRETLSCPPAERCAYTSAGRRTVPVGRTRPRNGTRAALAGTHAARRHAIPRGDLLNGRGPGSRDEHIAALNVVSRLATIGLASAGDDGTFLQESRLSSEFAARLQRFSRAQGTAPPETWNAVALLRGTTEPDQAILLSAHLDAYGIGSPAANGDRIYNGADDDASGVVAVLALAQALASGPRPQRTVIFALFGGEEIGGAANAAFLAHPPVPLASIVANVEFEMIGRPDRAVAPGTLWLTGFERTTLGPNSPATGPTWCPILTHVKISSAAPITSPSPGVESSPRPSPASASTPTITAHPTSWAPSTSITSPAPSLRCSRPSSGSPALLAARVESGSEALSLPAWRSSLQSSSSG